MLSYFQCMERLFETPHHMDSKRGIPMGPFALGASACEVANHPSGFSQLFSQLFFAGPLKGSADDQEEGNAKPESGPKVGRGPVVGTEERGGGYSLPKLHFEGWLSPEIHRVCSSLLLPKATDSVVAVVV